MAEVIYVRGEGNAPERVWENAHPRGSRSSTKLTLFDYVDGKRKQWLNWSGKQPPPTAQDSEASITSVLDLYDYIKKLAGGSLIELHFFTHGWEGGPVLFNTFEDPLYEARDERDPNDKDPRIKDFRIPGVLGGSEGARFKKPFSSSALVKLWGCTHREDFRQMIKRYYLRATNDAAKETIKKEYQQFIRDGTYQFKLHEVIDISVYAAPLGWGTNPYLPFGIHGEKAEKIKPKYRGKFPPSEGDQWWRVSQFFRPDRGREFYTRVLGAKMDILDYVAYTDAITRK